ncbi:hypothetical protein [Derxia lacustris]|uniref:hypothetical protein n=1 Tax=Derxia lacustris TaxID=764842 RepID=UPI000A17021A|nr:hypothetical protein [Derxia lacustris]
MPIEPAASQLVAPGGISNTIILAYPPVAPNATPVAGLRYARIYQNPDAAGGPSPFLGLLPYEVIGYVRRPDPAGNVTYQLRFTNYAAAAFPAAPAEPGWTNPQALMGIAWSGRIYYTPSIVFDVDAAGSTEPTPPELRYLNPLQADAFAADVPPAWLQQASAPLAPSDPLAGNPADIVTTITQRPDAPTPASGAVGFLIDLLVGAYVWIGTNNSDPAPKRAMVLFDPQVRNN